MNITINTIIRIIVTILEWNLHFVNLIVNSIITESSWAHRTYRLIWANQKNRFSVHLTWHVFQQKHRAGLNRVPMGRSAQIMGGSFRQGLNSEAVTFSTRLAVQPPTLYKSNREKSKMAASYFCILPNGLPKWFYSSTQEHLFTWQVTLYSHLIDWLRSSIHQEFRLSLYHSVCNKMRKL